MPDKTTLQRAARDKREGKSPSTQAGEFVREEMDHIREGKHGARSSKQAIAIGLSKARRAGVELPPPKAGTTAPETRRKARLDTAAARKRNSTSRSRGRAALDALKREGTAAGSKRALSRQARKAAAQRPAAKRSAAARKAAATRRGGAKRPERTSTRNRASR